MTRQRKRRASLLWSKLVLNEVARASRQTQAIEETIQSLRLKLQATTYPRQGSLLASRMKRKGLVAGRRSGKTSYIARRLIKGAFDHLYRRHVYLGQTLDSAAANVWRPLKELCKTIGLDYRANETTKILTLLVMGVEIGWICLGGSKTLEDLEKWRGANPSYGVVIIDECQAIRDSVLCYAIDEVFEPALVDSYGDLECSGTPARPPRNRKGRWYDIVKRKTPDKWEVTEGWCMLENPFLPNAAEQLQNVLKTKFGGEESHPVFASEWLGKWDETDSSLIFAIKPEHMCDAREIPRGVELMLGIDLGASREEKTLAFVVVAHDPARSKYLYVVRAEKHKLMDVTDLAAYVKGPLTERYGQFSEIEIDTGGLGNIIAEELSARHGIPCRPAEKSHKAGITEFLSGDVKVGLVRFVRGECDPLIAECADYRLDEDGGLPVDAKDHCIDAWTYISRRAKHYAYEDAEEAPKPGTSGYADHEQKLVDSWNDINDDEPNEREADPWG